MKNILLVSLISVLGFSCSTEDDEDNPIVDAVTAEVENEAEETAGETASESSDSDDSADSGEEEDELTMSGLTQPDLNLAYEVIEVVAYVKQVGSNANWELTAGQIDSTDHYLYWNTAGTKLVAWADTDGNGFGDGWVAFDINASADSLAAIAC